MVFVRVNLIKGRLSAQQKQDLGAKLVQPVADTDTLESKEWANE
jgi:phenylpyruvate tautomerase PptA (4-oxalocrotonate tautomerase family)